MDGLGEAPSLPHDTPPLSEIGVLLPYNQRQHRTLHIRKDVLLRIVLVTVPRVSRSCEHFPYGFDLHLPIEQIGLDISPGMSTYGCSVESGEGLGVSQLSPVACFCSIDLVHQGFSLTPPWGED